MTGDNWHHLKEETFSPWKQSNCGMSRGTELSPSLEVLGIQLDKAMINLLQPHCWTFFEEKVRLEMCWHCFQPELSCDPTWWLYRAGTVWRHSARPAKQGVRQPVCSSLMLILIQENCSSEMNVLSYLGDLGSKVPTLSLALHISDHFNQSKV